MSEYAYRHGEAWLATRLTGGAPNTFSTAVPEIDSLSLSFSVEKIEHRSKRTSIAAKDVSVPYFFDATGSMTVSEDSAAILEKAFFGTTGTIAGGSFPATAFEKTTVEVNDIIPLPDGKTHASSIVLTDSTGSPVTLDAGTHYEIVDADAGLIKILSLSGLTQPLKVAGTEAAGQGVSLLKQRVFELWMRFKGINIVKNDAIEVLDLYRIQLSPTSEWQVMGDGSSVSSVTLEFDLLKDSTKAANATFGQYGRLRR